MYSRPSGDGWPARIATRRSVMIVSYGSDAELIRTRLNGGSEDYDQAGLTSIISGLLGPGQ